MRTRLSTMTAAAVLALGSVGVLAGCDLYAASEDGVETGISDQSLRHAGAGQARARHRAHRAHGRRGGRGWWHRAGHGPGDFGDDARGGAGGAAIDPDVEAGGAAPDHDGAPASGGAAPGMGGAILDPGPGLGTGGFGSAASAGAASAGDDDADPGLGGSPGGYAYGVCGDGYVDWWSESCDDGDVADGDGCSSACGWEPGWACDWSSPSTCHPTVCGDGLQEGSEGCDDGNAVSDDGCSDVCTLEPFAVCNSPGEPCRAVVCGDGVQDFWYLLDEPPADGAEGMLGTGGTSGDGSSTEGGAWGTGGAVADYYYGFEGCDDGNDAPGDGCSEACLVEAGYICDQAGAPCREPRCGDGRQDWYVAQDGTETWESCDDGNAVAGDGCSEACAVEPGYVCDSPGAPCREPRCGDGRQDWYVAQDGTETWESCDDGNAVAGDGCSEACAVEPGYVCDSPGAPCREPRCGDGFQDYVGAGGTGGLDAGGVGAMGGAAEGGAAFEGDPGGAWEECDDGNSEPDDGCSEVCTIEAGWACWYTGEACHRVVCGDGYTDWPEECDDGNSDRTDGCDDCRWDGTYPGTGGSFAAGGAGNAPTEDGAASQIGQQAQRARRAGQRAAPRRYGLRAAISAATRGGTSASIGSPAAPRRRTSQSGPDSTSRGSRSYTSAGAPTSQSRMSGCASRKRRYASAECRSASSREMTPPVPLVGDAPATLPMLRVQPGAQLRPARAGVDGPPDGAPARRGPFRSNHEASFEPRCPSSGRVVEPRGPSG